MDSSYSSCPSNLPLLAALTPHQAQVDRLALQSCGELRAVVLVRCVAWCGAGRGGVRPCDGMEALTAMGLARRRLLYRCGRGAPCGGGGEPAAEVAPAASHGRAEPNRPNPSNRRGCSVAVCFELARGGYGARARDERAYVTHAATHTACTTNRLMRLRGPWWCRQGLSTMFPCLASCPRRLTLLSVPVTAPAEAPARQSRQSRH